MWTWGTRSTWQEGGNALVGLGSEPQAPHTPPQDECKAGGWGVGGKEEGTVVSDHQGYILCCSCWKM